MHMILKESAIIYGVCSLRLEDVWRLRPNQKTDCYFNDVYMRYAEMSLNPTQFITVIVLRGMRIPKYARYVLLI